MPPLQPGKLPPAPPSAPSDPLAWAHPVVREWFAAKFGAPTEPQERGWPPILDGKPALISAPTGSGKTLAAFLIAIDKLLRKAIAGELESGTEVVYVSPLKALSNDIQKNLELPLAEIQRLALERGHLCPEIRAAVRTGDTLPADRRAMLKRPPHILVTTPESLYILLTAEKSRNNLRRVRTVIVDEIHAMAADKRGSHLALSLERLDALVSGENKLSAGASIGGMPPPQRIGLSATQNPIDLVANFLGGVRRREVQIVETGRRRVMDLAIETPAEELGAVATNAIWDGIYDRLAELAGQHRSTLVFVNTRRMVERLAFALGERLGAANVGAHHGSLSRELRLGAERKLKNGEIQLLVATASLELGIDIGSIDLVCLVNAPRAIAAAMQRVGRSGHWKGAVPKGRIFVTTRDDLMQGAALVRAMRDGALDRLEVRPCPLDVLMQQIVAACAAEPWEEDSLYRVFSRAYPYSELTRKEFEECVFLLSEGIESTRGRYGAYLLRDRVHGRLQARRGARTVAVLNGGSIPDTALFTVLLQPEGVQIATLDEDFVVDSSAGDVIQLGNASWRIQRIESAGRVLVEDAQGQPPNVPFWRGEAPQRTVELSDYVSALRRQISERTPDVLPGYISQTHRQVGETVVWLKQECGLDDAGAEQLIGYIAAGRAVLGAVPTTETLIAERFFDEGGGMQLVLHAPFGGRINKAWGLALRKRFCRGFNFELQAAATDDGLNISLAEQHSFPLQDVFEFLTEQTVAALLEQAALASPVFRARWRWAAGRSLQLLRQHNGKRIAPQVQRTRSDDLLASVFPQVAACQENVEGDIAIPDHPLIREVMKDVLGEALDLAGLTGLLKRIRTGEVRCFAVDTASASVFAHEILNANPYAFLDDAPIEERRARAVQMRSIVPQAQLGEAGRLDPAAIEETREECRPDLRDEHEFHDLLCSLVIVPAEFCVGEWEIFFARLEAQGRAARAESAGRVLLAAAESIRSLRALWPGIELSEDLVCPPDDKDLSAAETIPDTIRRAVQGWMRLLGPVTSRALGERLGISAAAIWQTMLALEMQGTVLRGVFERRAAESDEEVEWCERRLLQRIHRKTMAGLRRRIEPVSPAIFMQWLLRWQRVAPQRQLMGEQGVLEALRLLEGFEAPAIEWERSLLPQRVVGYDPRWLDNLCLQGVVGWGRISPHPAFLSQKQEWMASRRVVPTSVAPVTFFLREEALWMECCLKERTIPEESLQAGLSGLAFRVRGVLEQRGAMFAGDLARGFSVGAGELDRALWELVAAGLVTADGFDSLRILIDPRRKQAGAGIRRVSRPRTAAGRWSLLAPFQVETGEAPGDRSSIAESRQAETESACRMLLRRYGVVFRDLVERETTVPRWRELLGIYRRMEAQGLVRGGRFVNGFGGEQFALPEAVESLREMRRCDGADGQVTVAASDPLNLVGVVVPGERPAAIPGRTVSFAGGVLCSPLEAAAI